MDVGQPQESPEPPELRMLWPELAPESADQPLDQETAVLAERRAKVFRLYTRGLSIRAIAEHETVLCSKSAVGRDVQHVLESYRLLVMQDAHAHVVREVARLVQMETDAWTSWENSKGESIERTEEEHEGTFRPRRTKRRTRDGDPRYFQLAIMCHDRRCRLLGISKLNDLKDKDTMPPVKLVAGMDPAEMV